MKKFEEMNTQSGQVKPQRRSFAKWVAILFVSYLCLTSFFTALYFTNTRLNIELVKVK